MYIINTYKPSGRERMHTHRCQYCDLDFTPWGNASQAKYCTIRCRDGAARLRRREKDKLVRPNMSHLNQSPGLYGLYTPMEERYTPEFMYRIKRGENPVREEMTNFKGEAQESQEDILKGGIESMVKGEEEDTPLEQAPRIVRRKLTSEEIDAATKRYIEQEKGLKVYETAEDARHESGIRVEEVIPSTETDDETK